MTDNYPWMSQACYEPAPITRTPSLTFKAYGVMCLAVMAFVGILAVML